MRQRVILRRVFVAVLLLLFVDTAVWAVLCHRIEQDARDAIAAARQDGWAITADGMRWGGWPLAAAIDLSRVAAAGTVPPGLVWQAESVRLELAFRHPATLSIGIAGSQSVEAHGIAPIPLTAGRAVIHADLTAAAPLHASVGALRATLPGGIVTLDGAELTLPGNGVTADFTTLSLPGVATPIGSIHLRAMIDPPLPPDASPAASARAWRQAGGQIAIPEASLHWDTLDATGSGRITLDERLQPQAEGMVTASGLPGLLDALVLAGALAPAQAGAAKAVIAVLAAPSGGERVQLPISLADGLLRLARFPLLRFQPLAWN